MKTKLTALLLVITIFFFTKEAIAQQQKDRDIVKYIETYYAAAIREMKRHKIPASIKLAQAIMESDCGDSELALKSNNHFGIKCKSYWHGEKVYHDDDEPQECFRKYSSVEDSFKDHSVFLVNGDRYATLFALKLTDYRGWAEGLRAAGYATNPLYASKIIRLIEDYELYRYDQPNKFEVGVDDRGFPTGVRGSYYADITSDSISNYENSKLVVLETSQVGNRQVYRHNRSSYLISQSGDTWEGISRISGVKYRNLIEFNDVTNLVVDIEPGSYIYLTKKRKSTGLRDKTYVVINDNETLYSISQKYALLTEVLCEANSLMKYYVIPKGKTIILK